MSFKNVFSRGVFAASAFFAASAPTPAFAGPEWVEQGDAGSDFVTGQPTAGVGQLNSIRGELSGFGDFPDLGDLYLFTINTPTIFEAHISSATFDPQLFLFNITVPGELFGLLANMDTATGLLPAMGNQATDQTGAQVLLPGAYAIAVTGFNRIPVGINGALFNFASLTEVSGPDGPSGINPLSGWTGEGQTGQYTIDFTGSGFYVVPAPGALALLMLAAMVVGRRRRRALA